MSHFELVSIVYYQAKSIFGLKQVVQMNLSFPISSWSVKLIHNSSVGKLVFSLKMSIVTINGSGIVDSGVIWFNFECSTKLKSGAHFRRFLTGHSVNTIK